MRFAGSGVPGEGLASRRCCVGPETAAQDPKRYLPGLCSQSFVLEFHFEPNDYFSNSVLTKTYKMKSEPDKADPFSFEGPEIVDCDG